MPMKGRFPIRRTLEYLQKGDIVLKNRVKIMTVNYNTSGELSDGARSELTAAKASGDALTATTPHTCPQTNAEHRHCVHPHHSESLKWEQCVALQCFE